MDLVTFAARRRARASSIIETCELISLYRDDDLVAFIAYSL